MKQKFGYVGMREEGFKLLYDLKTHTWKRPKDCYNTVCSLYNNIRSLCAAKNICEDIMKYQKERYLFWKACTRNNPIFVWQKNEVC